ncbi:hypothetical protein CW751_12550 [Brumimicrobium salinarum]|uniref:Sulfatase N-terminal domain-containing protein n=2 Tax=Brumimicrobium salinarum TaxID=2058658 RepID=A0A2I0R007_9FLAO|nr:hypothetical protein CW751_12550 [Brumimicrobium salinarum]
MEIISLFYFDLTLAAIDQSILNFSWDQANLILDNYFVFMWYYLLIPLPIITYFLLVTLLQPFNKKIHFLILPIIGLIILIFNLQFTVPAGSFSSLPINKTYFFIHSFFTKDENTSQSLTDEEIAFYQKTVNLDLNNADYPLYHKVSNKNTLKPFFDLQETPPNIVFLVVESLSSSFSGPEADEISYTPFLDSLAQHSLYFDNSLATSERSFAVLPSMLGSLPHGKMGFTNNPTGYPNTETLATWLFDNGYEGNFHFGGYARFDYMEQFIKNQGFKNVYDRKEFNYEGTGLKTSVDSIPFGIPDKAFLKSVLSRTENRSTQIPFIDVYLTLSMHYPYMIENHEQYYKKVRQIIEAANVKKKVKRKHKKYISELATFLYTDDALAKYFQVQKQREHHKNTIYVILGDHMMGEIAQSSAIEKYRSVLMIYSPLLTKSTHFKGVNSHLDIAPSFYNLISNEYNFSKLHSVAWLGEPFDTSSTFQSNRTILFMLNNRKVKDILHENFYLSNQYVFKLNDRLNLEDSHDKKKKKELKKLLEVSRKVHRDVVQQNIIIPSNRALDTISTVRKNIIFNEKKEFYSIFSKQLEKSYSSFHFNLKLRLIGDWQKNIDENPSFVYTLMRNGENLIWASLDLKLQDKDVRKYREFHFSIHENLDYRPEPGDEIRIFFWDKSKSNKNSVAEINNLTIEAAPISEEEMKHHSHFKDSIN